MSLGTAPTAGPTPPAWRRYLRHLPARAWLRLGGGRAPRARLDYPRADISLRVTSRAELYRAHSCAKEPWTVDWIERWLRPDDVLYDIGANVGAYALVAAKSSGGRARVVAFEPGYASFAALCENILVNGCGDSITPLPVGLGAETRLTSFNYRDLRPGAADHTFGKAEPVAGGATAYSQPVLGYRLDDLIAQFGLPPPNHVKVDVDGSEGAVLEGARNTLASSSLRSLMVEIDPSQSTRVTGILEGAGFGLRSRIAERNGRPMPVWYGLFARGGD